MINKIFIILILFILIGCSNESYYHAKNCQCTQCLKDEELHDANCTCDECMEEDTITEIEDTLDYD